MNNNLYHRTRLFFSLATIIPWTLWILAGVISHIETTDTTLQSGASILAFLGLIAPVLVTFVLTRKNRQLARDISGRFFNLKGVPSTYIIVSLTLMPFSILLAQAVSLLFGYSIDQFQWAKSYSFTSGVFPVWVMLIIAPILEELAWHTYGTDSLRTKFSLFKTSVLFAGFWAIWHIPLSSIKDYYHSHLASADWIYGVNFLVSLIPFVLIMNWIYYKSNRNILLPILFHISAGFFNELFATHPMSKVIQTCILALIALYIILNDKIFFFTKNQPLMKNFTQTTKMKLTKNIRMAILLVGMLIVGTSNWLTAQEITQTIQGHVYDEVTHEPLSYATLIVTDTDPLMGTVTDVEGNFKLENIKVGRQTIIVSMIGYSSYEIKELLVSSGQIISLSIAMQESGTTLDEVIVRVNKSTPLNSMAQLSSRQFTVEETQRYAGGLDDPARLVTSFAGVANPAIGDNGISVRGNSPDGLLWRIEGVEVPNPNHFANLTIAGGGLISAISSQMMANSDFYTGAFPAEFGNASSGVFDINLRQGNQEKRQYAFEAGLLGIGAMAQGPFSKHSESTYIVNYRNSTMALIAPLLPDEAGVLKYQDLSFKTNFRTKNNGNFTFWGIGAVDGVKTEALDSMDWKSIYDRDNSNTSMHMYATALSHKLILPDNAFLKSTIAYTGSGLDFTEERLDMTLQGHPQSRAKNRTNQITFQSDYTKRLNNRHSNKTGLRYTHHSFEIDVKEATSAGEELQEIATKSGNTGFIQLYSQSKFTLTPQLALNAGLNTQYLILNGNYSIEPRVGLKYNVSKEHSVAVAYGIHSRMEQLPVYFVSVNGAHPNKDLDFMKSSHLVFSYQAKLGSNLHLSIEPYYQFLNNVPVSPYGYASTLNNKNTLFYNEELESKGSGRNLGIDFTLEKYLSGGYYYMLTASVFDSKYNDADGVERNTRFNRNFVFNLMAGKEWHTSKNNIIGANIKLNFLGGNRKESINIVASDEQQDVIYGETDGNMAFSQRYDAMPVISFTLSYRINKPKYSSVWSLQVLNATGTKEYANDVYNLKTNKVETNYEGLLIPNISYKIEF